MYPYIIKDAGITVIVDGKPYLTTDDSPNYPKLVEAIRNKDAEAIKKLTSVDEEMKKAIGRFGDVEVFRGHVTYRSETIHGAIVNRILQLATLGLDVEPVARFLDNVNLNPSGRAVQDLFDWIEFNNMPITSDGHFIAYKIIKANWRDVHSGKFDNSIGRTVSMPRNQCNDDPTQTCSYGLHACGAEYLPFFGQFDRDKRVLLVKVNPRDVVAFPKDYKSKFRCCQYQVIEEIDRETAANFFGQAGTPVYDGAMATEWNEHNYGEDQPADSSGVLVNVVLSDGTLVRNQLADVLAWTQVARWQESEEDVASVVDEDDSDEDDGDDDWDRDFGD